MRIRKVHKLFQTRDHVSRFLYELAVLFYSSGSNIVYGEEDFLWTINRKNSSFP